MADKNTTEEYGGTSWSNEATLSSAASGLAGCGTQTAAIACGGGEYMSRTEEYNGSAWSSGGNMSQSKRDFEAVGILTSALCFGGDTGSLQNRTEKYKI